MKGVNLDTFYSYDAISNLTKNITNIITKGVASLVTDPPCFTSPFFKPTLLPTEFCTISKHFLWLRQKESATKGATLFRFKQHCFVQILSFHANFPIEQFILLLARVVHLSGCNYYFFAIKLFKIYTKNKAVESSKATLS